jgi:hypothetical protein
MITEKQRSFVEKPPHEFVILQLARITDLRIILAPSCRIRARVHTVVGRPLPIRSRRICGSKMELTHQRPPPGVAALSTDRKRHLIQRSPVSVNAGAFAEPKGAEIVSMRTSTIGERRRS